MLKRRSTINFYEHVQIGYKRLEQIWQPVNSNVELDTFKVNKDIPPICILLSKISLSKLNQGDFVDNIRLQLEPFLFHGHFQYCLFFFYLWTFHW